MTLTRYALITYEGFTEPTIHIHRAGRWGDCSYKNVSYRSKLRLAAFISQQQFHHLTHPSQRHVHQYEHQVTQFVMPRPTPTASALITDVALNVVNDCINYIYEDLGRFIKDADDLEQIIYDDWHVFSEMRNEIGDWAYEKIDWQHIYQAIEGVQS